MLIIHKVLIVRADELTASVDANLSVCSTQTSRYERLVSTKIFTLAKLNVVEYHNGVTTATENIM